MDKIIYTDVDSTVLNFNAGWEVYLRSRGIHIPYPGALHGYHRLTDALDIEEEIEMEMVHGFFGCEEFYTLPACDGAREAVQRLYSDGWQFVAITACPAAPGVAERRKANLEASLGVPFLGVHLTGLGGSKRELLSTLKPAVWVEDHYENAVAGHELGFRTFLISLKHNHHQPAPMTRVDSWSEIVEQLEAEFPCTAN